MAKKIRVVETIIDDMTGEEQPEGTGKSFTYVWNGRVWEIDLGDANASAVEEMMGTLTSKSRRIGTVPRALLAGEKVNAPSVRTDRQRELPAGSSGPDSISTRTLRPEADPNSFTSIKKRNNEHRGRVRQWARENGFDQAAAGKLKEEVIEAWNNAFPDDPVPEFEGKRAALRRY